MTTHADLVLHLPSGLAIERPLAKLLAFAQEEYATYDGVATALDSTITIHDITLSVMMNSWLMATGGRSVYGARERIGRALERIPPHTSLLDDHAAIPWDAVRELFNEFETVKGAKLAVATKILHKKRPQLLPMFDRQVLDHYRQAYPNARWQLTMGPLAVQAMERFREDLLAVAGPLTHLRADLAQAGFPLTPVRLLEALIWIERSKTEPYYSATSGDE